MRACANQHGSVDHHGGSLRRGPRQHRIALRTVNTIATSTPCSCLEKPAAFGSDIGFDRDKSTRTRSARKRMHNRRPLEGWSREDATQEPPRVMRDDDQGLPLGGEGAYPPSCLQLGLEFGKGITRQTWLGLGLALGERNKGRG